MHRTILGAVAALCLAAAAAADPVEGTWRTQPSDTGATLDVRIAACGGAICGTAVRLNGPGNQAVVGRPIIWDMRAQGGGAYRGGKVWAPDQDKTYNSKMTLSGDRLKVEGCVLVICRGQTWSRVN